MKNTGKKVWLLTSLFGNSLQRTVWTDGKEEFVKVKGQAYRFKKIGQIWKFDKEANRMLPQPAYEICY